MHATKVTGIQYLDDMIIVATDTSSVCLERNQGTQTLASLLMDLQLQVNEVCKTSDEENEEADEFEATAPEGFFW